MECASSRGQIESLKPLLDRFANRIDTCENALVKIFETFRKWIKETYFLHRFYTSFPSFQGSN